MNVRTMLINFKYYRLYSMMYVAERSFTSASTSGAEAYGQFIYLIAIVPLFLNGLVVLAGLLVGEEPVVGLGISVVCAA